MFRSRGESRNGKPCELGTQFPEFASATEFIPGRLYFASMSGVPGNPAIAAECHLINTDNELIYEPFFDDFGPVHMGMLYRFCKMLQEKLDDKALEGKKIVYWTRDHNHRRANGAFLISCFCVINLKWTPDAAYAPLMGASPPFAPFKDVYGGAWNCTVLDCIRGVYWAQILGWLNFDTFNLHEYFFLERIENGDMCVIVPGRFLAFSDPTGRRPQDYLPAMQKFGVTAVVRLNKKGYDKKCFTDVGIKHHDMYFTDGGNPSEKILQDYLTIAENEPGSIGIHCKAGLGRTGVLNGCYIMKHYRWTANETIAFMRVCRPGTVIGPQQQWLKEMEPKMIREGDQWREKHGNIAPPGDVNLLPPRPEDYIERRCKEASGY